MTTETLDAIVAAARSLPRNALDGDDLPLPNAQTLQREMQWHQFERADRDRLIKEVADVTNHGDRVRSLFLLWSWESESDLREKIVTSFPVETGVEVVPALELICLHETPDATGDAVIEKAKEQLKAIANREPAIAPVRHRIRVTGQARRTAAEALARIEEVQANRKLLTR